MEADGKKGHVTKGQGLRDEDSTHSGKNWILLGSLWKECGPANT